MLTQRRPRVHNDKHLDFIRQLSCVICMDNTCTEAAHIRYADPRAAKRYVGKQEKPDDKWALPLCGGHHRQQHSIGELEFWKHYQVDPIFVALALYSVTGDFQMGEQIILASTESLNANALSRTDGGLHDRSAV